MITEIVTELVINECRKRKQDHYRDPNERITRLTFCQDRILRQTLVQLYFLSLSRTNLNFTL